MNKTEFKNLLPNTGKLNRNYREKVIFLPVVLVSATGAGPSTASSNSTGQKL